MEAKSFERRYSLKEKVINKDYIVEDDFEDDMDEEEERGSFPDDDRKKKALNVASGRRGSGGGRVSPPRCQVEKCGVDLTEAKRYHRRHKVCDVHAKASVVTVGGLRQRFCQQCSRFHELSEFDEAKRSCRRRLAGHNERRRKNSTEPYGEGSSRKGVAGTQLRDSQFRQADERGRPQVLPPENNINYKHCQIR